MHIVLSGYYGFDNVGDDAIMYAIIQALRKIDAGVHITVLSNNPAATEKEFGVSAVNRWKLAEVSAVLKRADGLISGGGSLMQDATSMKTIPYYAGIIRMAKMHGTPVFVYAQGMGPINKGLSKWITKSTFNKVDGVTVRDIDSLQLLHEIGVRVGRGKEKLTNAWTRASFDMKNSDVSPAHLDGDDVAAIVPDPVIGIDASEFHCGWLDNEMLDGRLAGKEFVSVSVRDWPSSFDFKKEIAAGLDLIAASGVSIVFIPMHGEHDDVTSHEIASMMQAESIVAPFDVPIEEKIAIIGGSKLLVGMRLHSLIFAGIAYTPFVGLSYDPKIDSFAAIARQPVVGHVVDGGWDGAALAEASVAIIADETRYASEVASLRERIDVLKTQAALTSQMAWATFKK